MTKPQCLIREEGIYERMGADCCPFTAASAHFFLSRTSRFSEEGCSLAERTLMQPPRRSEAVIITQVNNAVVKSGHFGRTTIENMI